MTPKTLFSLPVFICCCVLRAAAIAIKTSPFAFALSFRNEQQIAEFFTKAFSAERSRPGLIALLNAADFDFRFILPEFCGAITSKPAWMWLIMESGLRRDLLATCVNHSTVKLSLLEPISEGLISPLDGQDYHRSMWPPNLLFHLLMSRKIHPTSHSSSLSWVLDENRKHEPMALTNWNDPSSNLWKLLNPVHFIAAQASEKALLNIFKVLICNWSAWESLAAADAAWRLVAVAAMIPFLKTFPLALNSFAPKLRLKFHQSNLILDIINCMLPQEPGIGIVNTAIAGLVSTMPDYKPISAELINLLFFQRIWSNAHELESDLELSNDSEIMSRFLSQTVPVNEICEFLHNLRLDGRALSARSFEASLAAESDGQPELSERILLLYSTCPGQLSTTFRTELPLKMRVSSTLRKYRKLAPISTVTMPQFTAERRREYVIILLDELYKVSSRARTVNHAYTVNLSILYPDTGISRTVSFPSLLRDILTRFMSEYAHLFTSRNLIVGSSKMCYLPTLRMYPIITNTFAFILGAHFVYLGESTVTICPEYFLSMAQPATSEMLSLIYEKRYDLRHDLMTANNIGTNRTLGVREALRRSIAEEEDELDASNTDAGLVSALNESLRQFQAGLATALDTENYTLPELYALLFGIREEGHAIHGK